MTDRLPPTPARFLHLPWSEGRGYPIPSTTMRTDEGPSFAALSERRKLVLATFDWCGICGLRFGNEPRWIVTGAPPGNERPSLDDFRAFRTAEAPVHEICLLYAVQACPFLLSPRALFHDEQRAGASRSERSVAVGYETVADISCDPSDVQPDVTVLSWSLADPIASWTYLNGRDLADRFGEALATEEVPAVDAEEIPLIVLFNDPEEADTVTGGALMAGAAGLEAVMALQGLDVFDRDTCAFLAWLFRYPDRLDPREFEDPATAAVLRLLQGEWVAPSWLVKWRGRIRVNVNVGRNERCPCGSGAKFKTCHGR